MESIRVSLADRSYSIVIQSHLFENIGRELAAARFPSKIALISNPTVDDFYGKLLRTSLQNSGFSVVQHNVPDGEEYKNLKTLETIYDFLIENNLDRGCGLIALGGGVVGDMAGFAAATFLRGIPYVQVPTTLLSQVDSSVGGKTAVNHPLGKNLIGAFYQPEAVYIDISTLETLPIREISAGLAEVVKYGVIYDAEFFTWLENNAQLLKQRDPDSFIYAIRRSCQIKAEIVAIDEREGSIRAHLNYGHTFGHAVEKLSGYGQWKHGEAVAIGMVVAAQIASHQGLCTDGDVERISSLLQSLDLPVTPPDFPLDDYVTAMKRDKKVSDGTLTLVLNRGIGEVILKKVPDVKKVFSFIFEH